MQTINIDNPQAVLTNMLIGAAYTKTVSELCTLGVADILEKHGPLTSEKICEFLAAPDSPTISSVKGAPIPSELFRLLRLACSAGIYDEIVGPNGELLFGLNKVSEYLCDSNPNNSKWALASLAGRPMFEMFGSLSEVIRTGQGAPTIMRGMSTCYEWFQSMPEEEKVFQLCLKHSLQAPLNAMKKQLDFSSFKKMADIGAGQGHVLRSILESVPHLKGVHFDAPHISRQAKESNSKDGILGEEGRVEYVAGNFFESVPAADAYVISRVLGDWSDSKVVEILKNMAASMEGDDGRIFILENVMPVFGAKPTDHGLVNYWYDFTMMVVCGAGARERNAAEFQQIFDRANLSLVRIVPLQDTNFCILEVKKAE